MKTPLRCLIVEDVEDDMQLLLRQLRLNGYDVTWERVDAPEAMRAALERQPWDLVLSDFKLPHFNGRAALEVLQASGHDLPFILVSGTIGEEQAVALMKAGAHDYVMKGQFARLAASVERELLSAVQRRERSQALKALLASEEKFKAVFAHSNIGKSTTRLSGELEVNQAFCDLLGYAPAELQRRSWQTISHPDDVASTQAVIDALLAGKQESARFTKRYLHKDGSVVWADVSTTLNRDATGQPLYFITAVVDITKRMQAEAAVRASEQQLRSYLESAGDAIYKIEMGTGQIWDCNAQACRALGYTREELLALSATAIESRLKTDEVGAIHRELQPGEVRTVAGLHRRKDGSVFPVEIRLSLLAPGQPGFLLTVVRDITERQIADKRLRESETRFRILSEHALAGIYIVKDGVLAYVNPALAKNFGYAREELIGADPLIVIHPNDRALVGENIRRRLAGEIKSLQYEFRGLAKNGEVRHIEVLGVGTAINDRPAVIGNILDITERKRAEAALKESETKFRRILETVSLVGVVLDQNSRITLCNDYLLGLTGWKREEVLNQDWFDLFIPPDVREKIRQEISANVIATGKLPEHFENEIITRQGERRVIAWNNIVLRSADGSISGVAGIGEDITERKRMETELRENAERLGRILEATSGGVWDWNILTGDAVFSPGYSSMLGYTPDEFAKAYKDWKALVHPDDFERVHQHHQDHFHHNKEFSIEFRMREKSGRWHWIHSRGLLVERDPQGQSARMIGTHTDIQERKTSEEALRLAHERLRRFVDANVVGILIANASGAVIEANDYYLRLVGYNRAELEQGKVDWRSITPSEWLPADEKAIRELSERGTCTPYEKEYLRRDGTRVPVLLADTLLPGPEKHIAAFALDLSEQKRAEQALRESEERYRQLINHSPDAIALYQDGRIIYVNPAALRMFGASKPEELIGTPVMERVHPDFRPEVARRMQQAITADMALPLVEERFLRLDGTTIDVEVAGGRLVIAGQPAIQVIVRDITERHRAEAKVIEQLDELRRWQDVMVEREGRVLEVKREVNEVLARLGEPPRYPSAIEGSGRSTGNSNP